MGVGALDLVASVVRVHHNKEALQSEFYRQRLDFNWDIHADPVLDVGRLSGQRNRPDDLNRPLAWKVPILVSLSYVDTPEDDAPPLQVAVLGSLYLPPCTGSLPPPLQVGMINTLYRFGRVDSGSFDFFAHGLRGM